MIRSGVVGRLLFVCSLLLVATVLVGGSMDVRWLPVAFAAGKTTPPDEKVMPPDGKVTASDAKVSPPDGKGGNPDTKMALPVNLMGDALQVAGYLLIFIILAASVVYFSKRFRPQWRGGGPIFIEDGRNLAPGVGVRLIRVGVRYWLIGVTKENVTLLGELTEEDLLEEDLAEDAVDLEPEPVLAKGRPGRGVHEAEPSFVERGGRR